MPIGESIIVVERDGNDFRIQSFRINEDKRACYTLLSYDYDRTDLHAKNFDFFSSDIDL